MMPDSEIRSISRTIELMFTAHVTFSFLVYVLLGPSAIIQLDGLAAICVFNITVILMLRLSAPSMMPLSLTASLFFLMFFVPRIVAFQVFPAQNITFVAIEPLSPNEFSYGLTFIALGNIAMWAGMLVSAKLWNAEPPLREHHLSIVDCIPFSLVAFGAAIYVAFVARVSVYDADPSKWGDPWGWLTRIFDTDVALLAVVVWFFSRSSQTRLQYAIALTIVVLWLLLMLMVGSRGGPLRIVILSALALFAVWTDPRIRFYKILSFIVAAFLLNSAMYPLATLIRFSATSTNALSALSDNWFRFSPLREVNPWPLRKLLSNSEVIRNHVAYISPIITRLGLVDYPLVILSRPPRQEVVDRYLSVDHSLKNFANNMVLGTPFPENDVMSSRIFTMAFRDFGEDHVRSAFLSEPWTLWGFSFLKGGYVGGLLIIFLIAALIQLLWVLLRRFVAPSVYPYAATAFLFVPVMSGMLQFFGLDHWLTITAHFSLSLCAFLASAALTRSVRLFAARRALGNRSFN